MNVASNIFRKRIVHSIRPLRRKYATEQPPPSQPQYEPPTAARPNPHRQVYKQGGFGRPIALNFLVAMCTFQLIYLSWLKLESMEVKQQKQDEITSLEAELKSLSTSTISAAKEAKEQLKEKSVSWLPWK